MRYLALPLFALINTFAVLILTVFSIPLTLASLLIVNAILVALVFRPLKNTHPVAPLSPIAPITPLSLLCLFILACAFLYGLSHTLLPTFHYDSFTNWNMRSKISFESQTMLFDSAGGLVEKPHYPFLYHALQITAMQFVPEWSEPVANGIHFLLTLSSLFAVYLLLSKMKGARYALVTSALIVSMPLMTLHTGGSYADITLISFALLSATLLMSGELLLSALLIAACVWTKAEGLFFCLIPWLLCLFMIRGKRKTPALTALALSAPWLIFALWNGMSLTPHGTADTSLTFNLQAISYQLQALFVEGSFGILWYLLLILVPISLYQLMNRKLPREDAAVLLWGLFAFFGFVAVYLFTSNTEYLILGQSFDRQMLLAASLLAIHIKP